MQMPRDTASELLKLKAQQAKTGCGSATHAPTPTWCSLPSTAAPAGRRMFRQQFGTLCDRRRVAPG
jgi:hypothetical protein